MRYFRLEDRTPVPCSADDWQRSLADIDSRRVANDTVDDASISTLFLGIDLGNGTFETLVVAEWIQRRQRYATWQEAEEGHRAWVRAVSCAATPRRTRVANSLRRVLNRLMSVGKEKAAG